MNILISLSKSLSDFAPIDSAPKDGSVIFIMDDDGTVDIAQWSLGEWNAEFGLCQSPSMWAEISIAKRIREDV